jgi:hypothetical protein
MPAPIPPHRRREDGAPSNWDRYLNLLARKGVPETMRPWYVRRVEEFLKDVRPESLSRLTEGDVTGYLQQVSSRSRLVDWQFRQVVDALQLLLVDLAQVPAGKGVDWDFWKAGGQVPAPDHPTLARSQPPRAKSAELFQRVVCVGLPHPIPHIS